MIRVDGNQQHHSTRWILAALPPALLTLPLVGTAFQLDERLHVYAQIAQTDANPPDVAAYVAQHTSIFFDHGNFRPAGRFVEVLVHGLVFETAEATSLAPHVVLGLVRLAMVVLAALVACRLVSALLRSAGVCSRRSLATMYPLVLATVLVANGTLGGSVPFPHTFIGSVVLVFGVSLLTVRDRDLARRRLSRGEYAVMAALGALAASFYDMTYVAPVVAAGFLVARAVTQGLMPREVIALAAFRRWVVLCAGFLLVFVPARLEIARRCAAGTCYAASEINVSLKALGVALSRAVTGFPAAGWRHNAGLSSSAGLDLGISEVPSNAFVLLLIVAMAAVAARFVMRGGLVDTAPLASGSAVSASGSDTGDAAPRRVRLALALAGLGSLVVLSAALIAGLSVRMQESQLAVGRAWRETLLTQVGWSLVITGGLAALDVAIRTRAARAAAQTAAGAMFDVNDAQARGAKWLPLARVAAASVLVASASLTLVANWRFAEAERRDRAAAATSLIALSAVNFNYSDEGNATRCALVGSYIGLGSDASDIWNSAQRVHGSLNEMALNRYGEPYCDADR